MQGENNEQEFFILIFYEVNVLSRSFHIEPVPHEVPQIDLCLTHNAVAMEAIFDAVMTQKELELTTSRSQSKGYII